MNVQRASFLPKDGKENCSMKKEKEKKWEFLPPKEDFVFKLLFGDVRNKDILADFLREVLNLSEEELSTLTITNPYLPKEYKEDKYGIVDVKVKTTLGNSVNVELQVGEQIFFKERIEFYNAKMVIEPIGNKDEYNKIKRAINIVITNFILVHNSPAYHHCFVRYDPINNTQFSDITEIHTLELKKLSKISDGTELWEWLCFLKADKKEEFEMIAQRNEKMSNVVMQLAVLSQDEKNRMLYEERLKQRRDAWAREEFVRREGIQLGREEGKQLSKKVFAMYLEHKSPEEIAKACDIPVAEVLAILPLNEYY